MNIRRYEDAIKDDWIYDPADRSVGIMSELFGHYHAELEDEVAIPDGPTQTRYHVIKHTDYEDGEYWEEGKMTELWECPVCHDRVLRTYKDIF